MIGFVEGFRGGLATTVEIGKNPINLLGRHLSPSSEIVLQTVSRMTFPELSEFPAEKFRLISNLIYDANNWFDVGIRAKEQLFQNKPNEFVALMAVAGDSHKAMARTENELVGKFPELKTLVSNFILDGEMLAKSRSRLSATQYREIDSGIAAVLVLGASGGKEYLSKIGVDINEKCGDENELLSKYRLFMVSEVDINTLNDEQKKAVGFQSVEMVLACIDDQKGTSEGLLLGIPSTNGDKELLEKYMKVAAKCGFSRKMIAMVAMIFRIDQCRLSIRPEGGVDLKDIGRFGDLGDILLLREWLNCRSMLGEMLR